MTPALTSQTVEFQRKHTTVSRAGLCVAALLSAVLPAGAKSPSPLRLTLDEAIQRGLETSHRIAEGVARGEAADASVGVRHAASRPQIAAQAGYTRTNHVDAFGILLPTNQLRVIYPDIPDNYRTRLDLQWPIYTGGRLDALERAARIDATASADDVAALRADLRLEVTRAYWALVTASESLLVVERSVARMDAHLRDIRNQLAAGLVPPNEVLTVEAQASRQRMLTVQARALRDNAETELGRLVGATPGTPIETATALDAAPADRGEAEALVEAARRQRPERAALVKRVEAARERGLAATAGLKPTVAVGGGVDYGRPNPRIFPREASWKPSWDASVNLSWPLFDGGRARSEMAETSAAARGAAERLAELDDAIAADVRQRARDAESSRAVIDAAADAVRSAAEARRVVGERFAAGVATSTDVLDAQISLLQAELDRTQALANARLADARLARAIGQ
jgi:outer membrane protein TolC